jgi:hypothetical protein
VCFAVLKNSDIHKGDEEIIKAPKEEFFYDISF